MKFAFNSNQDGSIENQDLFNNMYICLKQISILQDKTNSLQYFIFCSNNFTFFSSSSLVF